MGAVRNGNKREKLKRVSEAILAQRKRPKLSDPEGGPPGKSRESQNAHEAHCGVAAPGSHARLERGSRQR